MLENDKKLDMELKNSQKNILIKSIKIILIAMICNFVYNNVNVY